MKPRILVDEEYARQAPRRPPSLPPFPLRVPVVIDGNRDMELPIFRTIESYMEGKVVCFATVFPDREVPDRQMIRFHNPLGRGWWKRRQHLANDYLSGDWRLHPETDSLVLVAVALLPPYAFTGQGFDPVVE